MSRINSVISESYPLLSIGRPQRIIIPRIRWRRAWVFTRLLSFSLFLVVIVAPEWPAFAGRSYQLRTIVGQERMFDFLLWEWNALGVKTETVVSATHRYLPAQAQRTAVLDHLALIGQTQALESAINGLYSDPALVDPARATAELQAELDSARQRLEAQQPLVEAIVQDQVAAVLAEEGLTVAGVVFPPVLMHMTPLPQMLIISPRDRIEQIDFATLVPVLAMQEKEAMETAVYEALDLSALVVPIGGLGIYPAMVQETSSINWLVEVTAHEWTHHWLGPRPLGLRYLASPQMRTINETVASLVDLEIGAAVIERFYPEYIPVPEMAEPPPAVLSEPAFNFRAEMAETRVVVDQMLAQGKVQEAEAYMEERRQFFVANGRPIRKLNQAYFAFYGGYADAPGGAAGADPTGPLLREIRANTRSLPVFLDHVSAIRNYEDLESLYRTVVGKDPAAVLSN